MIIDEARIGDLAEQIRGVTYGKDDASSVFLADYLPVLRAGNITESGLTYKDLVYVPAARISAKQKIKQGDVIIAASSGSLDVVGKAAPAKNDFDGGFGAFCKVLRPNKKVYPEYFAQLFKRPEYRRTVSSLAAGANINNLRNEHLDDLRVPLPPLSEQRRIAAILDQADALRAKRREAFAQLDSLTQSIFLEMFGEPVSNPKGWPDALSLGDVADITSGVTKGRDLAGKNTRMVPYLAVANVQDKFLRLDGIKMLDATDDEIHRFRLQKDDLLLTEGGDPDKLGRGTLWNGELPDCIHQNHVFRVRLTSDHVTPIFLNWLVGSQRGKQYFLKSAKQTTGIASINMSQLRRFPLLVPTRHLQQTFAARIQSVEALKASHRAALQALDKLFASLQHRAFAGEL